MADYYIGQIFNGIYPSDAAIWCNNHNAVIVDISNNGTVWEIQRVQEPTADERREEFLKDFFNVQGIGYYRKKPKGYQSAIESINTAFNLCNKMGGLPANTLIFYQEPDFTKPEQCTEEWLVQHQIKLPAMSAEQFNELYIAFVTAWNSEEH